MSYAGKVRINNADSPIASALYGVCTTPGGTAAKVVSLSAFDALMTGVTIAVKFSQANTAANPTLNVNGTGDIPVYVYGSTKPGTTAATSWASNSIVTFTYDGTNWCMNDVSSNNSIISLLESEVNAEAGTRAANDTALAGQLAAPYDSTATYALGALCIHDDKLYECTTPISTAEEWTAGHWTASRISEKLGLAFRFADTQIGIASTASATVSGTGITAAAVDVNTFENIISTTGSYVFTYVNTDWTYNSNVVTLSNYGITVTGTAANGDTITVDYTAGTAPFKQNATYAAYPYRAVLPLAGVTGTMVVDVIFGCTDAISGIFAPIVESYDGGIYIYATNVPASAVTIPTIVARG